MWGAKLGVQVSRMKLHIHIHLDYVRVKFLSCKVVISNYIVLALIPCQIWLYFLQSFSLYVCEINCRGWVWEIGEESNFIRSNPQKEPRVEHMTRRWIVVPSWNFSQLSRGWGQLAKDSRNFLYGKQLCFALPSFYPHYIYPHHP